MNWKEINRAGISAISYDELNSRLIVQWEKSGYYVFGNVPFVEAANMAYAPNPSAYFKKYIEPHAVRLPEKTAEATLRLVRTAVATPLS